MDNQFFLIIFPLKKSSIGNQYLYFKFIVQSFNFMRLAYNKIKIFATHKNNIYIASRCYFEYPLKNLNTPAFFEEKSQS